MRLDLLLVERGLFETRAKAQAAIMAGQVRVEGQVDLKASREHPEDARLEVVERCPYVSRGGLKLEGGLKAFGVDPRGRTAVDVGASTGGFTDCLLQKGARRVFAVDVGHGQLDMKLRADPRVVVMERVNARNLEPGMFDEAPDLGVADASFISLQKILPSLIRCLRPPFDIVALIKPQFELDAKKVPKGVVRQEAHRREAIESLLAFAKGLPVRSLGVVASPLTGPKGNVEYLWHLKSL